MQSVGDKHVSHPAGQDKHDPAKAVKFMRLASAALNSVEPSAACVVRTRQNARVSTSKFEAKPRAVDAGTPTACATPDTSEVAQSVLHGNVPAGHCTVGAAPPANSACSSPPAPDALGSSVSSKTRARRIVEAREGRGEILFRHEASASTALLGTSESRRLSSEP